MRPIVRVDLWARYIEDTYGPLCNKDRETISEASLFLVKRIGLANISVEHEAECIEAIVGLLRSRNVFVGSFGGFS